MNRERIFLGDSNHFIELSIPQLKGEEEVECVVSIRSGHYSVQHAKIFIPALTIQQFYKEIIQIHHELKGTVVLTNRDDSLFLKITFHSLGQLQVEGTIQENPSEDNILRFVFQLNQSYLLRVIEGLKKVVE
ncbi:WapI family immunity protein [Alkalicoccobacillus gibsonii]|uniref:WapI family immunity protein n=1 Tax=Alkalicoccobacillus gibsonii TaxID=79881 RepID=UPI003CCDBD7E